MGAAYLFSLANISKNLSPAGGPDSKSSPPVLVKGAGRAALSHGRCPNPTLHSYLHLSSVLSPFMDNVTIVAHGRCSVMVGLYHEQRSETKESNNRSWPAAGAVACTSNAPLGAFQWPLQPSSQPVSQQWGAG